VLPVSSGTLLRILVNALCRRDNFDFIYNWIEKGTKDAQIIVLNEQLNDQTSATVEELFDLSALGIRRRFDLFDHAVLFVGNKR